MTQMRYSSLFPELDTMPRQKSREEIFNDYDGFVDKFKPKKTTDDCYTPPEIYQVICQWVNDNIIELDGVPVVRPFYPGGDFEAYEYPANCIAIDNPPFSILARIRRFYHARGIKYFLFAPTLTLGCSAKELPCTYIICGERIEYENGATINTSFVTNLDCGDIAVWCAGDLAKAIRLANAGRKSKREVPVYEYPPQVTSAALLQRISKAGVIFKISARSLRHITRLDAQKAADKSIYGGGWLLSEAAAAEKAAAEKAAAEKAAAEAAAEKAAEERILWALSGREKAIINNLE